VSTELTNLRIGVTGAGGFLGPVVCETLARLGARVQAIVGPPGEAARTPRGAASIAQADICDQAALRKALANAEVVVHLAGPASVAASFDVPERYVRIHTGGTATLLEACRANRIGKVVYVSSAEVYGRPLRSPVDESHPLSARSPYAAAKIGAEKLLEAHTHAHDLRAVVLRPFSIYGPGASPQSLIARIIGLARQGYPIALRDLRPVRDYCFVADLAEAVASACRFEGQGLEIFNIGTMQGTSVEQVANLVLEILGGDQPISETRDRERPGTSEILELIADNRRAREVLRWEPATPLRDGLRMALESREG
jgi:nucleoside-diphosphate-sugar epimerase